MTNDLAKHIEKLNAETAAWVAAGPDRWASGLTTDAAHWAEYGITTPEQLDKYLLVSEIYEATRSAWGYKPHWGNLMEAPIAELQAEAVALRAELDRQHKEELAAQAAEAKPLVPTVTTIGDIASFELAVFDR